MMKRILFGAIAALLLSLPAYGQIITGTGVSTSGANTWSGTQTFADGGSWGSTGISNLTVLGLTSGGLLKFSTDTGLSRDSVLGALNVDLGNGSANDKTGILNLAKVSAASGSGSAPSYTFAASGTTGMAYGGSNNLAFALGGSSTALVMDSSGGNPYISGNAGGQFVGFQSNGDLNLQPHAGNKLYMGIGTEVFGQADVAAPVAQIIGVQNVVAGTSNTAGVDQTRKVSAGTGTGVAGNFLIQCAPHGSTGSTQNTFTTCFKLNGDTGVLNVSPNTATPAAGSTTAVLLFGSTSGFGIYYGSGAPTVTAAQGSIYMRSDGSSTSTRAYINTTGSTTWTAITTAG